MHRSESSDESRETRKENPIESERVGWVVPKESAGEEEREAHDLSGAIDHPIVQKYQPKFLARGGEHVIYDIPGHPDIVVKVETETMRKIQSNNVEKGLPLGGMDPELLPHVTEFMQTYKERQRMLVEHFGREHTLSVRQALMKVPVTEQLLTALHDGVPPVGTGDIKEAWAIVRVQKRAQECVDPTHVTVMSGYAENRHTDPDAYKHVTDALVECDPDAKFTDEEYRSLLYKPMPELLDTLAQDPALAATLKDFVERTIEYAKATGEMLDLAGRDNVTVFKKDDSWNYRLVDALYPGDGTQTLDAASAAITKAANGEVLHDGEMSVILNAINFARTINGLALKLGVRQRITLVPEEVRGKVDFRALLG